MNWKRIIHNTFFSISLLCGCLTANAQFGQRTQWTDDGQAIIKAEQGLIIREAVADPQQRDTLATPADLTPAGSDTALSIRRFTISQDGRHVLINTNTRRVWRYDTRGDYWVYDRSAKSLKQLGKALPEASLMYAKLSPDGRKAAYVSGHNLYVEDLTTGIVKPLT